MRTNISRGLVPALVVSYLALVPVQFGLAQQSAELALEGQVEAVYLNTKISEPTYVIQISTKKASPGNNGARLPAGQLPAAGESVFVLFSPDGQQTGIVRLPHAGDEIRTRITSSAPGKWQATGANWFETVGAAAPATEQPAPTETTDGASPLVDVRGMTCEAKFISGQLAFEVKSVADSGPARDAGFQVGDILIAIDGKPVPSIAALKEFAAKPADLPLVVVDMNTGKLADVVLRAGAASSAQSPVDAPSQEDEAASAARIAASVGVLVTPSRIGFRKSAVVVSKIDPAGAAADAGIEVSDVILSVNDKTVADAAEFAAALPPEGGTITLLVRDSRSGQDVPVQVESRKTAMLPTTGLRTAAKAVVDQAEDLGLATDLTFYNGETAVRVADVERGSPSSRAGFEPGLIILAVNGKSVLHPDDFRRALVGNQGRIRLTVADPHSHRKADVEIQR